MLELQVAIVLLAFGVVTLASLLATQTRVLKRVERGFSPGSTVYVTPSNDPWVQKLRAAARLTAAELNQSTPATVTNPGNTLTIVSKQTDLKGESLSVTADVTPVD
jgi:hypothetical protein